MQGKRLAHVRQLHPETRFHAVRRILAPATTALALGGRGREPLAVCAEFRNGWFRNITLLPTGAGRVSGRERAAHWQVKDSPDAGRSRSCLSFSLCVMKTEIRTIVSTALNSGVMPRRMADQG